MPKLPSIPFGEKTMNDVTVIARPHPFGSETLCAFFPAGRTLAEILGAATYSCEARIGGKVVPRALWAKVKPKPGQFVHVRNFPQGGNGGKWLRLVLMVALIVVTYGVGAYAGLASGAAGAFGGSAAVWGAAFMMVGTLAITPMVGAAREIAA
ncbi:MAG TPA: hypothetical protein VN693_06515 [Rhodanobacteraceae bacterium]|nr:hypothetical protein [Rhodanobacteraceae bacterium]